MRILFQGDSITDGNRGRGEDPNHIIGHSYPYPVAAYYGSTYPEKNFDFLSRGVSGDTIRNLYDRWQTDTLSLKPDILCVLIGVNDAVSRCSTEEENYIDVYESTYRSLLEQALRVNPEIKFVILEPFTLNTGNLENFTEVKKNVKAFAKASKDIADDFGAVFIPLQKIFDDALKKAPVSYWIWDSIHPTYNGHGLIAQAFIKYTKDLFIK